MSDVLSECRKAYECEIASIDRDTLDAMTAWLHEDDGRIECFDTMLCAEMQIRASETTNEWFYYNVGTSAALHQALGTFSPFGWHDWDGYLRVATHPEHELHKRIPTSLEA